MPLLPLSNHTFFAIALATASTVALGDEPATQEPPPLIAQCTECHGLEGVSAKTEVPHLDRQDLNYLLESLELLATQARPSKIPDHVPADWSPAERKMVARFYSKASPERPREPFDPEKAKQGREVFLERCESCHENGGRDTDYRGAGSPRLAGQRMAYTIEQLNAYLTGQRRVFVDIKRQSMLGLPIDVRGGMVREALGKIGDTEVEAIAHFLASNAPSPEKNSKGTSRRSLRAKR